MDPDDTTSRYKRSREYNTLGRHKAELSDLNFLLSNSPENVNYYMWLYSRLVAHTKLDMATNAERDIETLRYDTYGPRRIEGFHILAEYYKSKKKYVDARRVYMKCIKMNPHIRGRDIGAITHYQDIQIGLGDVLFKQKKYVGAYKRYERAYRLNPDHKDASTIIYNMIVSAYEDGNFQRVMEIVNSYSIPKDDIDFMWRIGRTHEKSGNFGKAVDMYTKCIHKDAKSKFYKHRATCFYKTNYTREGDRDMAIARSLECGYVDEV